MELRNSSIAVVAAAALALALTACGGGSTSPDITGGTPPGGSSGGGGSGGDEGESRTMTVVVLAVDSFMPSDIDANITPNINSLINNGTLYTESRSVFSAETIPNHIAMMTGLYPDRNGIPTNNFLDRELFASTLATDATAEADGEDLDNPNELEAKTLFTWIDEKCRTGAIPRNAAYRTAATLSKTYLYLVFQGDDADTQTNDAGINNLIPDAHWDPRTSPGYIGPGSEHTPDNFTGPQAVTMLGETDFHFINLGDVDRSSHAAGSTARMAARGTADAQVGALITELVDTGRWENTVFILASDHGMDFSTVHDNPPTPGAPSFGIDSPNVAQNALSTQPLLDSLVAPACGGSEPMLAVQNGGTNSIVVPNPDASADDAAQSLMLARSCLMNFDGSDTAVTPTCEEAIADALGVDGTTTAGQVDVALCTAGLNAPVNADAITQAWLANPKFYSGNSLISSLSSVDSAAVMPDTIKSRHENLGDLVLVIDDGFKFSEPDPSGNPIPSNHGHMETIHNTIIVSGGASIVKKGRNVVGTEGSTDDHFFRLEEQAENIDVAATVAWVLGLRINPGDFPDAGATFPDYGDGVTRSGFDGRILAEAFTVPVNVAPTDCGVFSE